MSHEIRTPLTGVLGYAALLSGLSETGEPAREYIRSIEASAEALRAIVDNVLDFSELNAVALELNPHPLDFPALLADAVEVVRPSAKAKGLSLEIDLCPLPQWVRADGHRLRQVVLNLLRNAVAFTPSGRVSLIVRPGEGPGSTLRLEVRDTGLGIPDRDRAKIFRKFSQVDGTSTREHGGAGLGLAICKQLVELMSGSIGFRSLGGQGSTFWFELPLHEIADANLTTLSTDEDALDQPLQILVVDDYAVNRTLVAALLEPLGVTIVEAGNGVEAVAACARHRFDLILMDLQMPKMDGLEATRTIRAGATPNAATPIVAVSANAQASHGNICREAGLDDYLAKPIQPRELVTKVAAWSPRTARRQAVPA